MSLYAESQVSFRHILCLGLLTLVACLQHASAHVDKEAMYKAAADLKSQIVSDSSAAEGDQAASDDVLDSVDEMDTAVDRAAVQAAAADIRNKAVGAGSKDAAGDEDDVLDSATDADTGVDRAAVKAAAQDILQSTLGGHSVADAEDDVLDSAKGTDRGVDTAQVSKAARAIEREVAHGNGAKISMHSADKKAATAPKVKTSAVKPQVVVPKNSATTAQEEWGEMKNALRKQIEHKLHQQAHKVDAKNSNRNTVGLKQKSRFQMLSDTMLMPIQVATDPKDTYLDPVGGTQHREEMKSMYGSFERSDNDKQHMLNIKDLEDDNVDQPDILHPHNFAGGVGTKAHLHQVGSQIGAWYSSWWEHPNVEDLEEQTQEMLGLTSDVSGEPEGSDVGKRNLILKGLNVNGWEPGR